jgi:hypothetical protein
MVNTKNVPYGKTLPKKIMELLYFSSRESRKLLQERIPIMISTSSIKKNRHKDVQMNP